MSILLLAMLIRIWSKRQPPCKFFAEDDFTAFLSVPVSRRMLAANAADLMLDRSSLFLLFRDIPAGVLYELQSFTDVAL